MSELNSYDTVTKSSPSPSVRSWRFPYSVSGTDTSSILDNSGLVALTNAFVYKHTGEPVLRLGRGRGAAHEQSLSFAVEHNIKRTIQPSCQYYISILFFRFNKHYLSWQEIEKYFLIIPYQVIDLLLLLFLSLVLILEPTVTPRWT